MKTYEAPSQSLGFVGGAHWWVPWPRGPSPLSLLCDSGTVRGPAELAKALRPPGLEALVLALFAAVDEGLQLRPGESWGSSLFSQTKQASE